LKSIRCECGVFGIFGAKNAAKLTYFGLYALQHRGQEAAGIVTFDSGAIYEVRGQGEVNEVFGKEEKLASLLGDRAIGHNRYSTAGSSTLRNVQPLVINFKGEKLAAAHNGNLTNAELLKERLEQSGAIFQTTSDTEVPLHLIARSKKTTLVEIVADALRKVQGAYCMLFLTKDRLIAARDPHGFRPLALGKLQDAWVVASETCSFDLIGAEYVRDVLPGEIIEITESGLKSFSFFKPAKHAFCIFEFIYFARPDSKIFGENVDKIRRRLGRYLALQHPAEADIVIAVPDSSNTATLGFSEQSKIPFEFGFIRNHYVGRTFIDPKQEIRDLDVKVKFNAVKGVLKDKRVVVVDDSIVRGTTMKKLIQMLREAGVKEIHLRISSPPIVSPCFYGIDMPTKEELIASKMTVEEIGKYLGVDSIGYLSIDAMISMHSLPKEDFCVACFSGKYPTRIENKNGKLALEDTAQKPAKPARATKSSRHENGKTTSKLKVTP
jgi:amidophosphoribosyltransferase